MRQGDLAEATGVRSGWTKRMARLQGQGLVERHGSGGGSPLCYTITAAGCDALIAQTAAKVETNEVPAVVQQDNKEARAQFAKPVKGLVNAPVLVDDSANPGLERVYTQGWVAASWVVN